MTAAIESARRTLPSQAKSIQDKAQQKIVPFVPTKLPPLLGGLMRTWRKTMSSQALGSTALISALPLGLLT
jgi:hypothetical protein